MSERVETLSAEDAKLVTLARGAMGRAGTLQGAAVRDQDGRTYAAATVMLGSLSLTALQAAVAIAVGSGAESLESAVIFGGLAVDDASAAVARDMMTGTLILVDSAGAVLEWLTP